jgi:hypothetical protein
MSEEENYSNAGRRVLNFKETVSWRDEVWEPRINTNIGKQNEFARILLNQIHKES